MLFLLGPGSSPIWSSCKNVNRCEVTENTEKIWEATLEDVQEGSCVGPMFSVEEVD